MSKCFDRSAFGCWKTCLIFSSFQYKSISNFNLFEEENNTYSPLKNPFRSLAKLCALFKVINAHTLWLLIQNLQPKEQNRRKNWFSISNLVFYISNGLGSNPIHAITFFSGSKYTAFALSIASCGSYVCAGVHVRLQSKVYW